MNTKEIKTWLKATFGLKALSVTSMQTKNPYLTAHIRPIGPTPTKVGQTFAYPEEFPLDFRRLCLRVIYGEDCTFSHGGCAGNVRHHQISMHEEHWNRAITQWTTDVNKPGMLNPHIDPPKKLEETMTDIPMHADGDSLLDNDDPS